MSPPSRATAPSLLCPCLWQIGRSTVHTTSPKVALPTKNITPRMRSTVNGQPQLWSNGFDLANGRMRTRVVAFPRRHKASAHTTLVHRESATGSSEDPCHQNDALFSIPTARQCALQSRPTINPKKMAAVHDVTSSAPLLSRFRSLGRRLQSRGTHSTKTRCPSLCFRTQQ